MTILTPVPNAPNYIKFVRRYNGVINTLQIRNQATDTIFNVSNFSISAVSWYEQIQLQTPNLVEDNTYLITLFGINNAIIYQCIAFCTSQPISSFSVNTGKYLQHSTNNEFIIYE
jgi:hypothetical protein